MRTCTICTHDQRDAIDEALVGSVPYRELAKRHRVSISALSRHSSAHISPALARVQRRREERKAETLLDRVEDLYGRASEILDAAQKDSKPALSLAAIRELRSITELLGRLTGELRDAPGAVINIVSSEDWRRVRMVIMEALDAHPEIRTQVASRLLELEAAS